MTDQNQVTIRIGGCIYGGWKSVTIDVGIEQAARAFALAVTEKFPGSEDFGVFRNGDLVQVYIGPDLVCTGYIDSTPTSYTAQEIQVQIQGKSRTIDLVQCCPPSAAVAPATTAADTQWSNVKSISGTQAKKLQAPAKVATSWRGCTVGEIFAALAAPYGISVQVDDSISGKLATHTVNPGETVIESMNRLVTKSNLWLTDDPQGNLVITQLGAAGNCTDGLVLGKNILSGGAKFDGSTLFSKYVVSGQHAGTDTDFGRTAAEDRGVAEDSGVQRFRLTVIKDKGQSSNKIGVDRATFEQKYARARYAAADYIVQGWRQSDGSLWLPNSLVNIDDSVLQIAERRLITKVSYVLSNMGMTTALSVISPQGLKSKDAAADSSAETKSENPWSSVVKPIHKT